MLIQSRTKETAMESRHFFDDERQLTITVNEVCWAAIQNLANEAAASEGWLGGHGSDWDYLNIWIIRRLAKRPNGIDKNEWVAQAIL